MAALDIQVNKSKEYKDLKELMKPNKGLQDSPSEFMKFQRKEAAKVKSSRERVEDEEIKKSIEIEN